MANQLCYQSKKKGLDPQQRFRRACHALSLCTGGLPLGPSGLGGPRCGLGTARYGHGPSHFRRLRGLCRLICRWTVRPWGQHGLSLHSWSRRLARRSSRPPPHCPCTTPVCSWSSPAAVFSAGLACSLPPSPQPSSHTRGTPAWPRLGCSLSACSGPGPPPRSLPPAGIHSGQVRG